MTHALSRDVALGADVGVFETRDPARRAWLEWDAERTHTNTDIDGAGIVPSWCLVVDVNGPLVTYRYTFAFEDDGAQIESESVLRFRDRDELARSLTSVGFRVADVRDAPDRPGPASSYTSPKRCDPSRWGRDATTSGGGGVRRWRRSHRSPVRRRVAR